MIDALLEHLSRVPFATVMTAVSLGYLLGRVRWRGMSVGPAGGTLFVALALGAAGATLGEPSESSLGRFGFCLFIYSVGFEAGPRLLSRAGGGPRLRFMATGALVNVFAVACCLPIAAALGLDGSTAAGALAGALTSTPTFAAAIEEAADATRVSAAFALTYPFGLVGLIFVIQGLPRLAGWSMADDDAGDEAAVDRGVHARDALGRELTRAFRVEHPGVTGIPLRELRLTRRTGCTITRVFRKDQLQIADAETRLAVGDHLLATGRVDELEAFSGLVGPEVPPDDLLARLPAPQRVVVGAKAVVGRTLADLRLPATHRCIVHRVQRGDELLEPSAELTLERGDVVELLGPRDRLRAAVQQLGHAEPSLHATDVAVFSGGILLGLLLSRVELPGLAWHVSPGVPGGLLVAGLLLGRFRRIGPLRTHVPEAARQLVRDLGILLFVGETGLVAGAELAAGAPLPIGAVVALGAAITVLPVIATAWVARAALRLPTRHALGGVAGGMTSSAALQVVKQAADRTDPAISYAAAYAVGSVCAAIAGQVVVRATVG